MSADPNTVATPVVNNQEVPTTATTDMINPQLFTDPIGYLQNNQDIILQFCWNIIYAGIILFIGWILARIISSVACKVMTKVHFESTVAKFLANILKFAILAFIVTAALSKLGIQTASFVAIIGATSLAIGMSLQGSLANFASGVLLLIFRPIKVGEFVIVAGQQGTVEAITIFTTTILTGDNKMIVIPNGNISSGIITNYSRMPLRRVDFSFGIEYGSDLKVAKAALEEMFKMDKRILQDKGMTIVIGSLGESSINIICRVWTKSENYWGVYFDNTEKAVETLEAKGISFAFNTVTVVKAKD